LTEKMQGIGLFC